MVTVKPLSLSRGPDSLGGKLLSFPPKPPGYYLNLELWDIDKHRKASVYRQSMAIDYYRLIDGLKEAVRDRISEKVKLDGYDFIGKSSSGLSYFRERADSRHLLIASQEPKSGRLVQDSEYFEIFKQVGANNNSEIRYWRHYFKNAEHYILKHKFTELTSKQKLR